MELDKRQIVDLAAKYDEDHPWWTRKEKEIGDRIRAAQEFYLSTLKEIVEWKFKTVPSRFKRINNLLKRYRDEDILEITSWVLPLGTKDTTTTRSRHSGRSKEWEYPWQAAY